MVRCRAQAPFAGQVGERLRAIDQAMQTGDWDLAGTHVQGIKGAAAHIWPGSPLHQLAAAMEKMADERDASGFGAARPELAAAIDSCLANPG